MRSVQYFQKYSSQMPNYRKIWAHFSQQLFKHNTHSMQLYFIILHSIMKMSDEIVMLSYVCAISWTQMKLSFYYHGMYK